ncbi:hypothetical protein MF271_19380 (plasmid) [Deinococcus sp. KNUC1210]|uniref:hypothetical protein n=1 Tax=Deinococcus sp. KNUC1210 TaxID=2917691 RepID=UPI001EF0C0B6|nr:hypothetical protein [Deinococcus sp. KNUC1210]ULH17354.1 hypothetical protein MF271_19380 [Deinococcus sp. KNUC1210]
MGLPRDSPVTSLGISRGGLTAELLEVIPDVIEALGQDADVSGVDGVSSTKVLLDVLKPQRQRVGLIDRAATHNAYLNYVAGFPPRGGFSFVVDGATYVPVGETVNEGMLNVALTVPVVDQDVFYNDRATHNSGPSLKVRIIAKGALPFTVNAGLQDVQGSPEASHMAFVQPGVRLHGGDVLKLDSGDTFTVVPPIQHDLLGDTVGLSWHGDDSQPLPQPDPTPPPAGTTEPPPGNDDYWHTP